MVLALAALAVVVQAIVFVVLHQRRGATGASSDVLVLALGPGTPSPSLEQVRSVYLGRTTVWPNGTAARPFDRPAPSLAAQMFDASVVDTDQQRLVAPLVIATGRETIARVATTHGSIGYVMESEISRRPHGVRLVRVAGGKLRDVH